jgi:peptide-methionine (S)-S-oxide reductase
VIAYSTLLEVFFTVAHDPIHLNFQGPDVGPQYRSAIFYADESQKETAEAYISKLNASGKYRKPIVTQVVPLDEFYAAEQYHQDFMRLNPNYPYVVYWDLPKIEKLENEFPHLIAEE